jgi:hypothetical protein
MSNATMATATPAADHLFDTGPIVFVVTLVLTISASLFTVARLWSKWGIVRKVNADDFMVILSWVSWPPDLDARGYAVSV